MEHTSPINPKSTAKKSGFFHPISAPIFRSVSKLVGGLLGLLLRMQPKSEQAADLIS